MLLSEIRYAGPQRPVDSYGAGFFRVGGEMHRGAMALLPAGRRVWGGFEDRAFAGIDVLLVGCGTELFLPLPAEFLAAIEALGAGVEAMPTPAACRSYNMLLAESRRVGLAAFPI